MKRVASFLIGDRAFALDALYIREFVEVTEIIKEVTSQSQNLEGYFKLRGELIPILDLAGILGAERPEGHFFLIVRFGEIWVGFRVTNVLGMVPESQLKIHGTIGNVSALGIVGNFLETQAGDVLQEINLVQVSRLTPYPFQEQVPEKKALKMVKIKKSLIAEVGSRFIAFDLLDALSIHYSSGIKKGYWEHPLFLGDLSCQKGCLPVFKLHPEVQVQTEGKVVVLKSEHGLYGLYVDELSALTPYSESDVSILPRVSSSMPEVRVLGVQGLGDALLLNPKTVVPEHLLKQTFQSYQELYRIESQEKKSESEDLLNALVMDLGFRAVIPTKYVIGVIDFPSELIAVPGASKDFAGLIRFREKLVPVLHAKSWGQQVAVVCEVESQWFAFPVSQVVEFAKIRKKIFETLHAVQSPSHMPIQERVAKKEIEVLTGTESRWAKLLDLECLVSNEKRAAG